MEKDENVEAPNPEKQDEDEQEEKQDEEEEDEDEGSSWFEEVQEEEQDEEEEDEDKDKEQNEEQNEEQEEKQDEEEEDEDEGSSWFEEEEEDENVEEHQEEYSNLTLNPSDTSILKKLKRQIPISDRLRLGVLVKCRLCIGIWIPESGYFKDTANPQEYQTKYPAHLEHDISEMKEKFLLYTVDMRDHIKVHATEFTFQNETVQVPEEYLDNDGLWSIKQYLRLIGGDHTYFALLKHKCHLCGQGIMMMHDRITNHFRKNVGCKENLTNMSSREYINRHMYPISSMIQEAEDIKDPIKNQSNLSWTKCKVCDENSSEA
jgi:flagellar biosynthesis GTPase FlhF